MRRQVGLLGRGTTFLVAFLMAGLMEGECAAQALRELYAKIEPSVVEVKCLDTMSTATGFVWNDGDTVVTTLHVVDRSREIRVHYSKLGATRPARVEKVLKDADLVLLRVVDAPKVPVLRHTVQLPQLEEEIHSLGFALSAPGISDWRFTLRYGEMRLQDYISGPAVKRLKGNGYPSPDLEVLKLGNESLMPGLSGAPLFNRTGEVVGIGDGGLEQGAVNISWAIPAHNLDRLLRSTITKVPWSAGTLELFAAELQATVGPRISEGDIDLVKLRTRSLAELAATADDQLGLQQLSSLFPDIDLSAFRFDIYQEVHSGATVVLPQGAEIQPDPGGLWRVRLPGASHGHPLEVLLQLSEAASSLDADRIALRFEQRIQQRYPGVTFSLDPQWTYPIAYSRFDGLTVRRKAAGGVLNNGYGWVSDKYLFETLALRDNMVVALAVINTDASPTTLQLQAACFQGYQHPECSNLYQRRRAWAQMVLGVQLTSFSL